MLITNVSITANRNFLGGNWSRPAGNIVIHTINLFAEKGMSGPGKAVRTGGGIGHAEDSVL